MCLSFAATIRSRRFRSCFPLRTGQHCSHGRAGAELSSSIGEDVHVFKKGLGWTSICRIKVWLQLYMNFTRKTKLYDCTWDSYTYNMYIHRFCCFMWCLPTCQANCKAKMASYYPMSSWPLTFLACQHLRWLLWRGLFYLHHVSM